jgi:regulatory protein
MENLSSKEVLTKLYHYCTYQERCHKEVTEKLFELGVYGEKTQEIITHLIGEGFLNEERFAKAFASGKFRFKNWGRLKIIRELEQRQLSSHCIKSALQEIDPHDYRQSLLSLLAKKASSIEEANPYALRHRVAKFVIQKGFEPELVWEMLKENSKG